LFVVEVLPPVVRPDFRAVHEPSVRALRSAAGISVGDSTLHSRPSSSRSREEVRDAAVRWRPLRSNVVFGVSVTRPMGSTLTWWLRCFFDPPRTERGAGRASPNRLRSLTSHVALRARSRGSIDRRDRCTHARFLAKNERLRVDREHQEASPRARLRAHG